MRRSVLVVATLIAACGSTPTGPPSSAPDTTADISTSSTPASPTSTSPTAQSTTSSVHAWVGPPGIINRTWVDAGRLVAEVTGPDGSPRVVASSDGVTWSGPAAPPDQAAGPVVRFGQGWVRFTTTVSERCSAATAISTSSDGVTWTGIDPGPLEHGTVAAAAANEDVLALAWMESHAANEEACDDPRPISVFLSDDGRSFTAAPEPATTFDLTHLGSIDDMIWTGTLFLLAGSDLDATTFWYAFDGRSWTRHDAPLPTHVYDVDLARWRDSLLAVGSRADTGALLGWRSNGNVWESMPVPDLEWSANIASWDGGLVIMDLTTEPVFYLSSDAETWTRVAGQG